MTALRKEQEGTVIILVLLILAVFLIGSAAILNATQSTNSVLANTSFRTTALALSDTALADAKTYLLDRATNADTSLINIEVTNKYYPVIKAVTDADVKTSFTWTNVLATASGVNNAYNTQYVIERLCNPLAALPVADVMASCQVEQAASAGSAKVGSPVFSNTAQVLYRITVRVTGPKSAEVYTNAIMSL